MAEQQIKTTQEEYIKSGAQYQNPQFGGQSYYYIKQEPYFVPQMQPTFVKPEGEIINQEQKFIPVQQFVGEQAFQQQLPLQYVQPQSYTIPTFQTSQQVQGSSIVYPPSQFFSSQFPGQSYMVQQPKVEQYEQKKVEEQELKAERQQQVFPQQFYPPPYQVVYSPEQVKKEELKGKVEEKKQKSKSWWNCFDFEESDKEEVDEQKVQTNQKTPMEKINFVEYPYPNQYPNIPSQFIPQQQFSLPPQEGQFVYYQPQLVEQQRKESQEIKEGQQPVSYVTYSQYPGQNYPFYQLPQQTFDQPQKITIQTQTSLQKQV